MTRIHVDRRKAEVRRASLKTRDKTQEGKKYSDESGIRTHAPKDQMMLKASVLHRNCADLSLAP